MAAHILVVRPSSLGDIVHTMSLVSDVERHSPGTAIHWVAEEAFAPLVALDARIGRVVPVAFRRWRRQPLSGATRREFLEFRRALRAQRYDAILDLQEQLKGAIGARMARGRRPGFDRANVREPIATWLDDVHHAIDRNQHFIATARAMAAAALGYTVEGRPRWSFTPPSRTDAMPDGPYAVAFHATSREDKLWPEERWIELGRGLRAPTVLPWGSEAERARAERIASAIGGTVPPPRSLQEISRLFAAARCVVGLDTGLTHLAAALGTTTVGIYCGSDPALTGLYGAPNARNAGAAGRPPEVDEVLSLL